MQQDGIKKIIYGDNADMAFREWIDYFRDCTYEEWKERYTFVYSRKKVLKEYEDMDAVYRRYQVGDYVDYIKFLNEVFASSVLCSIY